MRFLALLVGCALGVSATCVGAATPRNSLGFYVAPTSHHVQADYEFEELESSTSLDFALFYARSFAHGAVRIEARYASREFQGGFETALFAAPSFQITQEAFLEIPVILYATQFVSLGEASLRISIGGGAYYAVLVSQDFPGEPSTLPDAPEVLDAGGYSRYGWVGDGGVALIYRENRAVFMNLRLQDDVGISGEPEQSIAREDTAFGFYAGLEWLF